MHAENGFPAVAACFAVPVASRTRPQTADRRPEGLRLHVGSRRTHGRTWDRGGPTVTAVAVVFRNPTRSAGPSGPADKNYWQPGNLRLSSLVCQLNEPAVSRYSPTNQNVQSSTGSTAMLV